MKSNPSIMSGGFVLASSKKASKRDCLLEDIKEPEPENLMESDVLIGSGVESSRSSQRHYGYEEF